MPAPVELTAIILVDHGSRRAESNAMLVEVAAAYRRHAAWPLVEPAHMELAEPTIAAAFARCVDQGATLIVVTPFFLAPGKHWTEDIPRLAAEAAASHPGVRHLVAPPLGIHPLVMQILDDRVAEAIGRQHDGVDS